MPEEKWKKKKRQNSMSGFILLLYSPGTGMKFRHLGKDS